MMLNSSHLAESGGYNGRVVELERHRPRDMEGGCQLPQDHVAQDAGGVVVIFRRVLHKTEPVHVAYVRLSIRPENQGIQINIAKNLLIRLKNYNYI